MQETILDRLQKHAVHSFVGRREEVAKLRHLLLDGEALVVFVHGIGGIGKSSVLEMFAEQARADGAALVRLDCRTIRPSEEGFLSELGLALGGDQPSLGALSDALSRLGERVVLVLDTYEVFRMMDTWLRQVFIPALGGNVRILVAGREAPVSAWYTTPGWHGNFRSIQLGPLLNEDAERYLVRSGVSEADIPRVVAFTAGHPLALKLAASAIAERPNLTLKEVESQHVIGELIRVYLADIDDPRTRAALEAASVVRRTTRSLLHAMLPKADEATYERIGALPFVESASDGLVIHDLVQQAIVSQLRAADPDRYNAYRRAAWDRLRSEFAAGSRGTVWRYTADMIYLIEHPAIHETFFPSDAHLYAIEPALPGDFDAIAAIAVEHDGRAMLKIIEHWWRKAPDSFSVARGRHGEVAGFYAMLRVRPGDRDEFDDPFTSRYWQHLQANPIPDNQLVLFVLRWIAKATGEDPSPVQGALWLDIKRMYMEYPQSRRIYGPLHDTATWLPIFGQLGFRDLNADVTLDGKTFACLVNDFGPQLVPGWLAGLVDAQFGIERRVVLDRDARELVIDARRVALSPLEFALIGHLSEHEGKAISRDELLDRVWGYEYKGGSNIVDAMVKSLRKKLGEFASCIETVSGLGYRLRWPR
jgi:hypothetical protein